MKRVNTYGYIYAIHNKVYSNAPLIPVTPFHFQRLFPFYLLLYCLLSLLYHIFPRLEGLSDLERYPFFHFISFHFNNYNPLEFLCEFSFSACARIKFGKTVKLTKLQPSPVFCFLLSLLHLRLRVTGPHFSFHLLQQRQEVRCVWAGWVEVRARASTLPCHLCPQVL